MQHSIIQINRDLETKCICGSTCEKISFEVANELGEVNTYGSTCIKSVLGIDTKHLENKRGVQTLKLKVVKHHPENNAYFAHYKALKMVSNADPDNIEYKVVFKRVIADGFNNQLKELNQDKTLLNYNYKATKAQYKEDVKVQDLEVGQTITTKELKAL